MTICTKASRYEPIPAHRKQDLNGDGIELRMNEHWERGWRRSIAARFVKFVNALIIRGGSVPINRRSRIITEGFARSPSRACCAVGFDDGDRPSSVYRGWSQHHESCNARIQPLVDRAMAALRSADAKPQVSAQTVRQHRHGYEEQVFVGIARVMPTRRSGGDGAMHDGVLCGGCDRTRPARWWRCAHESGIFVYAGTMGRGLEGRRSPSSAHSGSRRFCGKMSKEDFDGIRKNACPAVAPAEVSTANTMSSSFEALGMSLWTARNASPRESRLRSSIGTNAGQRDQDRPCRATSSPAIPLKTRSRWYDRRIDQRRAALSRDCRGASRMDHR
jgi:hypothetical protein